MANQNTAVGTEALLSNDDHLGYDFGPDQAAPNAPSRGAPVPRSKRQPAACPQPAVQQALQRHAMLGDKVERLEATVAQQQKQIETLTAQLRDQAKIFTAQLKEQATRIQKVSAQLAAASPSIGGLALGKPAPQVVNNP